MSPPPTTPRGKPIGQEHKSWKKINEERKALKRERRQERLIKQVENAEKLKELSKANEAAAAESAKKLDPSTISIAVPGSILENAQSPGLRAYLAGQIARAASIFRVNEIIVFDDIGIATARDTKVVYDTETNAEGEESVPQTARKSSLQLARILQYLECPQYLRKFFFPLHKDLTHSGLLNPLDTPHHLRQQSMFLYREGIVTERPAKEGRCFVNCGLLNDVLVDKAITPGVRVTVKLNTSNESKKLRGKVVSPDEPRRETGVYWGYTVRIAHSLADVFTKSPYSGGYDKTFGTSDRGANVQEVPKASCTFNHLLIVFGGLSGLETALANEEKLTADDPALLFDHYLNVLPKQGSRTIRTEEAILIALTALQEKLAPQVPDLEDSEYKELLPRSDDVVASKGNNPFEKPAKNSSNNAESSLYVETKGYNPFKMPAKDRENDASFEETVASEPFVAFANKERGKRNPFTTKVHQNERKRKHFENAEKQFERPMQEFRANKFKTRQTEQPKSEVRREEKQEEKATTVAAEVDDLEVVPANGTMPTKQKRKKQELDLSRFD